MDSGQAAILAGSVGVLGTIAGAALQFILSRQAAREDRVAQVQSEQLTRIRDHNLHALDETLVDLTEHLRSLTKMASGLPPGENFGPMVHPNADMGLVGDAAAVRSYFAAGVRVPPDRQGKGLTIADLNVFAKAYSDLASAIRVQKTRVLRDEALVVLDRAAMEQIGQELSSHPLVAVLMGTDGPLEAAPGPPEAGAASV